MWSGYKAFTIVETIQQPSYHAITVAAAGKSDRALAIAETIQSYYGGREKMLDAIANYENAQ